VILCTKCGKENQDHYKFCLGCGSELVRAAAAAPRAAAGGAAPAPVAAPAPSAAPIRSGPAPTGPMTAAQRGAPQAAAVAAAAAAPAPMAAPAPLAPPARVGTGALSAGARSGPAPAPAPARARATGASAAAAPMAAPAPVAAAPRPAGGATPCPNCGTMVPEGFIFCGACGTKIAEAASVPRTMFMGGSAAAAPEPAGRLIAINPDGSEGQAFPLGAGESNIGRDSGPAFQHDPFLSPLHAVFSLTARGLTVTDADSLNGVFLKITTETELKHDDLFRIGQELILFQVIADAAPLIAQAKDGTLVIGSPDPGYWGRIVLITGRERVGNAFPLSEDAVVLGRERADILFPEDGFVSGTHARLSTRDGRFYLTDLGSSNGTYIRILAPTPLRPDDHILMGQQLYRVDYHS
jgi:pSer/pThr/pTyr-binding forkhead associated (FHA) protein